MQEQENMDLSVSKDKTRLAEVYLIVCGLLISGEQVTISLLSIPTNSTVITFFNEKSYFLKLIPFTYQTFLFLIFFILVYHVLFSWRIHPPIFLPILISFLFGYLVSIILVMQGMIHRMEINESVILLEKSKFLISWISITVVSTAALTTMQMLKDFAIAISIIRTPNGDKKQKRKIVFGFFIVVLIFLLLFADMFYVSFP